MFQSCAARFLFPQGWAGENMSQALGVRTAVLKGVSGVDGQAYALRRVDAKQVCIHDFVHCVLYTVYWRTLAYMPQGREQVCIHSW